MNQDFKIWSPYSRQIQLVIENEGKKQFFPMEKNSEHVWHCSIDLPETKILYRYQVDGDKIYPDPCSHFQPEGVHGPSELILHEDFHWEDQNFTPPKWKEALIYELHVGTFSPAGRFIDVIEKLPYLKELGITHLELMPVSAFPGKHGWGYDGVYPFAPHAPYGRPEDLKKLIAACHQQGLAVILDVVYNHFGPSGNYFGVFAPYHTSRYQTPWGEAINFDDEYSDQVRQMVLDNVSLWLEKYHFDGLRLDAIHAIYDQSASHILEDIARHVKTLDQKMNKEHFLIAESDLNDPKIIRSLDEFGYGFTAQWSDDFHHAIHSFCTHEKSGYYADFGQLADIAKALSHGFVHDGQYSGFRKRRHGRALDQSQARSLITFIQNHDQIGNRAKGDRLSEQISLDCYKLAAALNLLAPTTPMLFQGEEWASSSPFIYFTDHQEAELAEAVRKGRTEEFAQFGWDPEDIPDPQDPLSFELSRLQWEELDWNGHSEVLAWYKKLIKIRKQYLNQEPFTFISNENLQVLPEQKSLIFQNKSILTALNFSDQPQTIDQKFASNGDIVLAVSKGSFDLHGEMMSLPANSAVIILKGIEHGL